MKLIVCPAVHAAQTYAVYRPSHVLGLLSPGQEEVELNQSPDRLELRFNDIATEQYGLVVPRETDMRDILNFAQSWDGTAPMLIYCFAGISRSTAAAFTILCQRYPMTTEQDIASVLRRTSPSATPNPLMIALADWLLERKGRMSEAALAIGRGEGCFEGQSFELALNGATSQ